jgi:hypothetical protein
MAGSADREYVQDSDHGSPGDEATNASIAPESPPAITVVDEAQPTSHARGSSTAPGLLDPGTTFNDAMRSPVNGLGQNGVEAGQPAFGSAAPQTNDLVALKNGLLAELNSGQYSGATLGHVQAILSDINTAISSANAAANGASVPGMEQALRASQLSIINAVNTDPALANPAPQNGPTEPVEPEVKPADPAETPTETTTPAETAETGDATDTAQATEDLDAAIAEMEALIAANPEVFSGLTVDDAEEIVQQIQLELAQLNEGDAPLGTAQSDSIDITDIVTGDIDLASLAAQVHLNAQGQEAGNGDVHILPQTAAIPVNDVPATIGTGEAPMIVVDHGHSGTPEPVNHLHVIWE